MNRWLALWLTPILVLVSFETAVGTQSGTQGEGERVEESDLFIFCGLEERMRLAVVPLAEHAATAGLSQDMIRSAAESRLRGARIYDEGAMTTLVVNVNVGKPTFGTRAFRFYSISVSYLRPFWDLRLDHFGLAETWSTGSAGQGGAQFILGNLGTHLDEFIVMYLRVRGSEKCRDVSA